MKQLTATALALAMAATPALAHAGDRSPTRPGKSQFTKANYAPNHGRERREEARSKRQGPSRANHHGREHANPNAGMGNSPT